MRCITTISHISFDNKPTPETSSPTKSTPEHAGLHLLPRADNKIKHFCGHLHHPFIPDRSILLSDVPEQT